MSGRRAAAGDAPAAAGAVASTAGRAAGAGGCGRGATVEGGADAGRLAEGAGAAPGAGAADAGGIPVEGTFDASPADAPRAEAGADSGAPKPGDPVVGTKAGVGGRRVEGGKEGAPNAVLAGGVRRGGENGGIRPAGGLTGVGVLLAGAAGAEPAEGAGARGAAGSLVGGCAVVAGFCELADGAPDCGAAGLRPARVAGCSSPLPLADAGTSASGKSSPQLTLADTGITPPHTEQRALTAAPTTLAGSTRNTDRHSGQDTFIHSSTMLMARGARGGVGSPPAATKSVRRSTEYTEPTRVLA